MDRLKKIIQLQKTQILLLIFIPLGTALLGNLMMDCIVRFVPDDDMTVFPLGTAMAYGGTLGGTLAAALMSDSVNYRRMLALGATRKEYILQTYLIKIPILIICGALCILCARFELWKFRTVFPELPMEAPALNVFSLKSVILLLVISLAFGMLVNDLIIRFGMRGRLAVAWTFPVLSMFCGVICGTLAEKLKDPSFFLRAGSHYLYPAAVFLCVVAIFLSLTTMLKEGV